MSLIEKALQNAKKDRIEPDRSGTYRSLASAAALESGESVPAKDGPFRPDVDAFDLNQVRVIDVDQTALRKNLILVGDSARQPAEAAYRMLRTRVMRAMRGRGWSRLGVTATGPGEGKTLTAINLAVSIAAERSQPVVLVDLDFRQPRVSQYLGIGADQFLGLSDYLGGADGSLEDVIVSPGIEGLYCVMNGARIERSSDLLASPRGKSLLSDMAERLAGALVIFDLPPLLATDDALVVAPMIDGLLFVVADGQAVRSEVASAAKLLAEFNVIGTVLNKSSERVQQGYYSY